MLSLALFAAVWTAQASPGVSPEEPGTGVPNSVSFQLPSLRKRLGESAMGYERYLSNQTQGPKD